MAPVDLLTAQSELFGSVFVVTGHLTRRTDRALEPLGLSTRQWLLLGVLTNGFPERSASLSEAAQRYGSSRQNVKQIAVGLERLGYLELVADPSDRRVTRLQLTSAIDVFDRPDMQERGTALLDEAFAGLSPKDTMALLTLVRRWLAALADSDDVNVPA